MNFQPYCEGNWKVDYNTITVNYPQGPWTISSEQIEYFEEKAEWSGSAYIFEISIKAKGWNEPYAMGRFIHGASGIRDALAAYAARNGLQYRNAESGKCAPASAEKSTQSVPLNQKPKRSGKLFWILNIPLAAFMILLLWACESSILAWISSVTVFAAEFAVYKLLKKGRLPAVALWIASIVALLIVFTFTDNGTHGSQEGIIRASYELKMENPTGYIVKPNQKPTEIMHDKLRITLPANVTDTQCKLTVSEVSNAPKAIKELVPLCEPVDIDLGEKHVFNNPITVSIPYDRTKVGKIPLKEAFVAVYFDESEGMWEDVPYEVDEASGVVNMKLYHLSTVQCYYSLYEGARIFDDGESMVIYPITREYKDLYRKYSRSSVNYSGNEVPQLIIDVSGIAKDCICAYRNMGFAMNGKTKIYMTPDNTSSKYNSTTGNVCITLSSVTFSNPKTMFMRNVGHELFHKAQAETLGLRVYESTRMRQMSFWLEASADYMGNIGVWQAVGKELPNRFDLMERKFFDTSLYATADPDHQYEAANFAAFVMKIKPSVTPMQLVTMANDYNASFSLRFDHVFRTDKYPMLLSYYDAFLNYILFDTSFTNVRERTNQKISEGIGSKSNIALKDNGSGVQAGEGTFDINIPAPFSAGFHTMKAPEDVVLGLSANAPVTACVMPDKGVRTVSSRVELASGMPGTVQLKKNEFVLFFSTSSSAKTVKVSYKAAAAVKKPDETKKAEDNSELVGLWDVKTMKLTDIKASAAYWKDYSAVTQGKGKNDEIAAWDEIFSRSNYYIFIVESKADPKSYIIKMGTSNTIGRDATMLPIPIKVDGNGIKAKGYNMSVASKEYLEFDLKLDKGKLSGTCKSTVNADINYSSPKYG
ncbi:MAG TPA: hypothetical protein VHT34_11210, partial [Clostridia bacterium]|nr:hypothetical protein [Clostridia bacterium]